MHLRYRLQEKHQHDFATQSEPSKVFAFSKSTTVGEEYVRMAALSTMLRMVNLFIALSLGVHREQFEHRI